MKTLVGINNLTEVNQYAYANHIQFFYRLSKAHPNDDFALCNPRRMSIDNMRNFCAEVAIGQGFDYLMFIDDDVLVPWGAFTKLQKARKDIIAGITYIRGFPFHPMVFDFNKRHKKRNGHHFVDHYSRRKDKHGLVKCDAVGFSCCLIKVKVLRKMQKKFKHPKEPFFLTTPNMTEDIFFCNRARDMVKGVTIYADPSIQTAHILNPDVIDVTNREARREYEMQVNPALRNIKD